MGENINSNAVFTNKHSVITTELSLVSFVEDNLFFVYCPALDITGYGNNEEEAKKSFDQTLKMYFEDTIDNNTLLKDLEHHGWEIKKQNKLTPPDFDEWFSWMNVDKKWLPKLSESLKNIEIDGSLQKKSWDEQVSFLVQCWIRKDLKMKKSQISVNNENRLSQNEKATKTYESNDTSKDEKVY